jgi:biotin-dependent carboxylase-like uncharacterized protein
VIEVLQPGPLTTIQDGGRPGYAHLGVPRSGAFDLAAMRSANHLVANRPDAPVLEVTHGGLSLLAHDAVTVAAAGAVCPGLDPLVPVTLPAGSMIRLEPPMSGLRTYLAFRGGLMLAPVLGSLATDTLSGLGPPVLRGGERIEVARDPADIVGVAGAPRPRDGGDVPLPVTFGPREDWFAAPEQLTETTWTVRADSDRIGIRLDGPPMLRAITGELPSEGLRPGAIQVPPDGRPIVLGPDAPVTGGYPVVAVVGRADLDRAAQLRPGDRVRFVRLR